MLTDAGLPAKLADVLADADLGMSCGELFTDSGDLRGLIGRPTTPWPTPSPTRLADERSRHQNTAQVLATTRVMIED